MADDTKPKSGGVSELLDKRHYHRDEMIFEEGDMGMATYIIQSGAVEMFKMEKGERVSLTTLRSGELFGEVAILGDSEQTSSAQAIEDSVIFRVPRTLIESRLAQLDKFTRGLIRVLVNNLSKVHKIYMKRPRSVQDNLNAVNFHLSNLRRYLDLPAAEPVSKEGKRRLAVVSGEIEGLKNLFMDHKDRRDSVLDRSDLTSQGKPEPIPRGNPEWDEEEEGSD